MSAVATASIHKHSYVPKDLVHRSGCPCVLTSSYRISTLPPGDQTSFVHEYTTMRLVHQRKNNEDNKKKAKNTLSLTALHHELEIDSLVLRKSGASNILLSKVSFDCLITDKRLTTDKPAKEYRDYISFDLKIPGVNSDKEAVFSYEMVKEAFGSRENLYAALEYFYAVGRGIANQANHKHGIQPDYNPRYSKHDQYILHTEQLLIAYLALPEASAMLRNCLRTKIRGKYSEAASVKVYNMGLHMHSTKTCCAPCEYSLLGLMNAREGFKQGQKQLGFLPNFQQACSSLDEQLAFTFPKKSSFRLLVTVTASESDATHKQQPTYTRQELASSESTPLHVISVKAQTTFQCIFTTLLSAEYDPRKLAASSTLNDKTVGISGSKNTPGSSPTAKKVKEVREAELDQIELLE